MIITWKSNQDQFTGQFPDQFPGDQGKSSAFLPASRLLPAFWRTLPLFEASYPAADVISSCAFPPASRLLPAFIGYTPSGEQWVAQFHRTLQRNFTGMASVFQRCHAILMCKIGGDRA